MNPLLIIGTFEALFLILLLAGKKGKSLPDLFLGIIFFLFALSIGTTWLELYNIGHGFPCPFAMNISWLFLFLHGPALWLYIKSLSSDSFVFQPSFLLHFVPFVLLSVIQYYTFINLPVAEKIVLVQTELFKEQLFYKISVMGIGISTITYYIWALNLIKVHRASLLNSYSKIDDIDLNWLRLLIIASLVCYSVNVALFNLDLIFHFASYRFLMFITYSFGSVYILVLGYYGISQSNIFRQGGLEMSDKKEKDNPRGPAIVIYEVDSGFTQQLLTYMEQRKPWLDPDITISRLAGHLDVTAGYLSGIINSQLNQNFFDFVNRYRTNEFKQQAVDENNNHLSIMGIAYNCGFNSKASFYRAFKKFEGISPTVYIESVSKK